MNDQVTVPFPAHRLGIRELIWSIVLALPFVFTHFLTPLKLHWAVLLLFLLLPVLVALLAALQLAAKQWPHEFSSTISVDDRQIVLTRPFGREVTLPFSQITKIVALSTLDAEYGESTTRLAIYTNDRKVAVGGDLLYRSNLLEHIQRLPGFDFAAYAESHAEEGSLLRSLLSKRTQIFKASL
jgi:hypothetical protein